MYIPYVGSMDGKVQQKAQTGNSLLRPGGGGDTTCATEFSFNWLDGKSRTTNGRRSDAELECNT